MIDVVAFQESELKEQDLQLNMNAIFIDLFNLNMSKARGVTDESMRQFWSISSEFSVLIVGGSERIPDKFDLTKWQDSVDKNPKLISSTLKDIFTVFPGRKKSTGMTAFKKYFFCAFNLAVCGGSKQEL